MKNWSYLKQGETSQIESLTSLKLRQKEKGEDRKYFLPKIQLCIVAGYCCVGKICWYWDVLWQNEKTFTICWAESWQESKEGGRQTQIGDVLSDG